MYRDAKRDLQKGNRGYTETARGLMSKRAAAAYERHEMPVHEWSGEAVREEVRRVCDEHGLECPEERLETMGCKEIFDKVFTKCGWHHTGRRYRRVDFYRLSPALLLSYFFAGEIVTGVA